MFLIGESSQFTRHQRVPGFPLTVLHMWYVEEYHPDQLLALYILTFFSPLLSSTSGAGHVTLWYDLWPEPRYQKPGELTQWAVEDICGSHSYNRMTGRCLGTTEAYPTKHQLSASQSNFLLAGSPKFPGHSNTGKVWHQKNQTSNSQQS